GDGAARLWACSCLRLLPLPEMGDDPPLLADPRYRRVVAAVELFACGLLGNDELRTAPAVLRPAARHPLPGHRRRQVRAWPLAGPAGRGRRRPDAQDSGSIS